MGNPEPVHINSFVVLDLETTGLPKVQVKTRITEISILGIERSHVLQSFERKQFMPRVVQKLNLCVYPSKFINPGASDVSGLSNELLEKCTRFDDDVFDVLQKVIRFLPRPVCILAHNGNGFDFPILRSEIAHLGKALPDDVYCADTLPAFRNLLYKPTSSALQDDEDDDSPLEVENEEDVSELEITSEVDEVDLAITIPTEILTVSDKTEFSFADRLESQCWDQALSLATEEAEKKFMEEVLSINLDDLKRINETTPISKRKSTRIRNSANNGRTANGCNKMKNDARKKLFPNKDSNAPKPRFRLQDCYLHLTGKSIVNAHRADSDTHALLECVVAVGPPLLDWIDNNCKPFNTIKQLW